MLICRMFSTNIHTIYVITKMCILHVCKLRFEITKVTWVCYLNDLSILYGFARAMLIIPPSLPETLAWSRILLANAIPGSPQCIPILKAIWSSFLSNCSCYSTQSPDTHMRELPSEIIQLLELGCFVLCHDSTLISNTMLWKWCAWHNVYSTLYI